MQPSHLSVKLLGVAAALIAASSAAAQVNFTETFDVDAGGWVSAGTASFAPFAWFNDATTCSTGAMRTNLYAPGANANDILLSPMIGTSNGLPTTISYSYKINNWSANTTPTPAPWGSIDVEYASNPAGPWTNIATITDEVQAAGGLCTTKSHTFTPPAGALYVRFNCNRTGGDAWWNIDDVSVIEASPIAYSENFDIDAGGWTAAGTATFAPFAWFSDATTCSTGAMRANLYGTGVNANDILVSPLIGTSNGVQATISYSYKINNWSANTTPTPAPWGTIDVEYASDTAGPWTNIATIADETQLAGGACIAKSHTFTPPAGPLYVRFNCNRTGGDAWWNFDDISVLEGTANPPASHAAYGSGCYDTGNSLYQLFADAALAGPALTGNVLELTPNGNGGYDAAWLAGAAAATFVTPTGAPLALTDDGEVGFTSVGFPSPYGAVTDIRVHGNGIVGFGSIPLTFAGGNNYEPSSTKFIGGTIPAVYAWHDYNVGEGGSIIAEDLGGKTLVTFDAVESYSTPTGPNPSTLQFQFDQVTGVVNVVFLSIDSDATSSFGSAHLIGFKPATSTVDEGSVDLATSLPRSVSGTEGAGLALSASPTPVSTPSSGTTVVYQVDNIPDAWVNAGVPSGVHFGALIVSATPDLLGFDLTALGMPGCNLYVGSLDVLVYYAGATANQTVAFDVPSNVMPGIQYYAQATALVFPGSLPNGQNTFGAVVSNGVQSTVSDN